MFEFGNTCTLVIGVEPMKGNNMNHETTNCMKKLYIEERIVVPRGQGTSISEVLGYFPTFEFRDIYRHNWLNNVRQSKYELGRYQQSHTDVRCFKGYYDECDDYQKHIFYSAVGGVCRCCMKHFQKTNETYNMAQETYNMAKENMAKETCCGPLLPYR